jgi:5'-deoxynucleotidase YfbR-like HD superfamily hydrolase
VEDNGHELAGAADYLYEMGHLKHVQRAGWTLLGIKAPESVAEHSSRVALVGLVLAGIAGADPLRTLALGLVHDAHETRIGDVPSVGRAYITTPGPEVINAQQTAGLPDEASKLLRDLTAEYEAGDTIESKLAHDADKLETLLQAREYASLGADTGPWVETSLQALRTDAGKQLAQAIRAGKPGGWIEAFQASYHELRAEAQRRSRQA